MAARLLLRSLALLLASASAATAMTVQELVGLDRQAQQGSVPQPYFDGLRDALYDFNAVLDSVGVQVFCPAADTPPTDAAELRRRVETSIEERRRRDPGFNAYAKETSVTLVALEVLSALHPCDADTGRPGQASR